MNTAALLPALALIIGAGIPRVADLLRAWAIRRSGRFALAAAVVLPVAGVFAAPAGGAAAAQALWFLPYMLVPLALLDRAGGGDAPPKASEWVALAAIWIPVALGWPPLGPADDLGSALTPRLLGLAFLLVAFVAINPRAELGFEWRLRAGGAAAALIVTGAVLILAVPVIRFGGGGIAAPEGVAEHTDWLGSAVWSVFGCALPKEVVHRGLIFGFLQRARASRHGPYPAMLISAVLFAASEAAAAPGGRGATFVLAAWAGLWLAWSCLRTGSLCPAIAAHAALDLLRQVP